MTLRPLALDEGGGILATVAELPGCMAAGATAAEAQVNVQDAIAQWVAQAEAMGRAVPWPRPRLVQSS